MTNCKAGDLAVVVRSFAGNEGKIVRCLEFVGTGRCDAGRRMGCPSEGPYTDLWRIDTPMSTDRGSTTHLMRDAWLRPIRDNPGTDEVIAKVGKPKKTPITVTSEYEAARIAEPTPGAHVLVVRNDVLVSEFFGEA